MKKKIVVCLLSIFVLAACVFFLWPRSFGDVGADAQSVRVTFIENTLEHDCITFDFNAADPEFAAVMEILDRYSYHMSLHTISSRLEDSVSMEGNRAGYWLYIDLYSEPDCYGDYYGGITSGGTGEVIVGDGVYRMGYFGNGKALEMMDEFSRLLMPVE